MLLKPVSYTYNSVAKPGKQILHKLFLLLPILFILCLQASGQNPNIRSDEIHAYAIQELSFGTFITGSSGGTVTITPEGNRFISGTVMDLSVSAGSPASFNVEVLPNKLINIQLPESAVLKRNGGEETMIISNFRSNPANSFISKAGNALINTVYIGATLTVGTANPPGDYSGTFTVTFNQE